MASPSPTRGYKPRLTEEEKKRNHIDSEKKRREAIRDGFDKLAEIVPGMSGKGRSEALVLSETVKFLKEQKEHRRRLLAQAREKGLDTTGWELGDGQDDDDEDDYEVDDVYTTMGGGHGSSHTYQNGDGYTKGSSSPDS